MNKLELERIKNNFHSDGYVIFDIRVTRGNLEKFDEKVLHAKYGNRKGAQLVLGYQSLKNFLLKQKKQIKKIEIAGYKSDWGKNVIYRLKKKETYLITVVIYKNINNSKKKINLYEQIPAELSK